ncbi:MAG: Hsp20/alpha crystallin family protein [Candidatus Dormibacteraeota bacterium]|nr:Hsp20/alpha crystallin family protein [Candidatus Dormibacteraeota bacterium]
MADSRFSDYRTDPLVREMLRVIGQGGQPQRSAQSMPINVWEEGGMLMLEAAMPGLRPEDVEVLCAENMLTIQAEVTSPDRDYLHQELPGTRYFRQIAMPADCLLEETAAQVEHGLLTLRVPKATRKHPERVRIQVNRASEPGKPKRAVQARKAPDRAEES